MIFKKIKNKNESKGRENKDKLTMATMTSS